LYHTALIVCVIFYVAEMQLKAQSTNPDLIILEGRVVSADSLVPLANTHIISKFNRWGTISNEDGNFKMYVSKYDSVLFSSIGFSPQILYVNDSVIKHSGEGFRVYMNMDTVLINEVVIRGFFDYETFKQIIISMEPLNLDQFYPDWEGTELLYKQPTPEGFKGPVQLLYDMLNRDVRLQRQLIRNRENYNELLRKLNRDSDTIPAIPEHMRELQY
jgi:hypothetical protein